MASDKKETKCPDCEFCQSCSKSRCRVCKTGNSGKTTSGLTRCFTYEEYTKWKSKKASLEKLNLTHPIK